MVCKISVLTCVAVCFTATTGAGQHARYVMPPGDTAKYHQLTSGFVTMQMPQGIVEVKTIHDATIRITVGSDRISRAWYDSLYLFQAGPGPQRQEPETVSLLGDAFEFRFDPAGRVELLSFPEIPAEIASMTDLSRQFDDFFITLPAEELAVGIRWTDTVTTERAARPNDTYLGNHVRSYRVERDTVIGGESAFILTVEQTVTLEASSPMPQEGLWAFTELTGDDKGFAIFNVDSGRLLYRTREGLLEGELRVTGGPQPLVIPQRYRYESTIQQLE